MRSFSGFAPASDVASHSPYKDYVRDLLARQCLANWAVQIGGFGGEISAEVTEHMFDCLKGPVKRMGGARIPIPFSIPLEEAYMISPEQVVEKAQSFF